MNTFKWLEKSGSRKYSSAFEVLDISQSTAHVLFRELIYCHILLTKIPKPTADAINAAPSALALSYLPKTPLKVKDNDMLKFSLEKKFV